MLLTILLLIACALIATAAIPLMLRLIPPNPIYGFPARKMNSEPQNWFLLNSFLGRALVVAAGIAAILLMAYNGTWLRSGWAQIFVFVLAMGGAVGATLWFKKKENL